MSKRKAVVASLLAAGFLDIAEERKKPSPHLPIWLQTTIVGSNWPRGYYFWHPAGESAINVCTKWCYIFHPSIAGPWPWAVQARVFVDSISPTILFTPAPTIVLNDGASSVMAISLKG